MPEAGREVLDSGDDPQRLPERLVALIVNEILVSISIELSTTPSLKGNTMKPGTTPSLIGKLTLGLATGLLCTAAWSAPECTAEPQAKWMPEKDMKAKITAEGYVIKRFLVSGNCYEIYGKNKQGKNVEIYFNPVTGAIVKQRVG